PGDRAAELLALLERLRGAVGFRHRIERSHRGVAEVVEAIRVKLIGARAHYGVDTAAQRPAVLGQEVRLGYLELLYGVGADAARDAGAPARLGEERLVIVVALNGEVVVDAGHAVVAQQAEARIARDPGREQRELIVAASVDRQVVDLLAIDEHGFAGFGGVDGDGFGG